jgi:hypothetical protein
MICAIISLLITLFRPPSHSARRSFLRCVLCLGVVGSPGKSIFDAANKKSLLFCRLSLEYANSHAQTPGEQQQSLFNARTQNNIYKN